MKPNSQLLGPFIILLIVFALLLLVSCIETVDQKQKREDLERRITCLEQGLPPPCPR